MILLLGGTSESPRIAAQLAEKGYRVLVSQATDVPLGTALHPHIEARSGPLDEIALVELIEHRGIRAIVDATHPYATAIHAVAARVAAARHIPYVRFVRPPVVAPGTRGVEFVPDHPTAAAAAFSRLRPVLLTTGSKNLAPYAEHARRSGVPLVVRVLDHPASRLACQQAGIPPERTIFARGPFSIEINRQHIRDFGIGVLVMKDSGAAGGTREKLLAAQAEGCAVIVVSRPATSDACAVSDIASLLIRLGNAGVTSE